MVSGGRADCGQIRKDKSKSWRLWGAGKMVRKKPNGVRGGSGLQTNPSKNEAFCTALGARGQGIEISDATGVRGEPGRQRASGHGRKSPDAHFFLTDAS